MTAKFTAPKKDAYTANIQSKAAQQEQALALLKAIAG